MSTSYGNFRISDTERADAIATLSRALGEGRITMEEFDSRCDAVTRAQFLSDLTPLFDDLPTTPTTPAAPAAPVPALLSPAEPALYSAEEVHAAHRQGRRTRAGVFWLGTLGSIGLTVVAATATASGASALPLLLIPTLFVLLYVMKVGPDSWYTPSVRQLERHRRELVRVRQLEIEAARAHEIAAQRAQRKQQVSQMTTDAIDFANRTVSRFTKR